ncbi:MAG: hypothetical protein B7Y07_00095 [Halothiobacillus sp. 24-54-40]|jgi:hypothetical protein|nr:MAG: hypothetical protein B7Y58_00090 [Halothiobacillus sp. 35-54-62]OYY55507.1 MAG: hypothetical protein B7Y53_03805 [Halothiobacillus sp. 28-55-5]OYZ88372.1 MAG: hypothetical protein B7Y07_00095 [Halothiobacillus sp. 24-54-40]OZA81680.1 MAG: hypothetical protein B7X64_00105 [Halothiobacillus sp. 39-53-45]HQS01828.1 hypothetical protein [Halothiobacillus sp.]
MRKIYFTAFILSTTLALAACSDGAPSSSDIEQALKSGMAKAMAQAGTLGGGAQISAAMAKVEIKSVKNLGCKKDEAGSGFNCNVETEVNTPFAGAQKSTRMLHLVKGSDGWQIAQ